MSEGFWDKHPQPWSYYTARTSITRYSKYVVTDQRHAEVFETTDEQIAAVICNLVNNTKLSTASVETTIEMFPITVARQSTGLTPRSTSQIK